MAISLHQKRRTSVIELSAWLIYRNFDLLSAKQFFKQLVNENFYSYTLFQTSAFALKKVPKVLELFTKEKELEKIFLLICLIEMIKQHYLILLLNILKIGMNYYY